MIYSKSIIICLLFINISFSQTREEIKIAKEYIKKNNIPNELIVKEAKKRGVSSDQVQKILKDESQNKKIEKKLIEPSINFENLETASNPSSEDTPTKIVENKNIISTEGTEVIKYFGYDLFKGDPALFQGSSSGMVDPNYMIGPGDEIIVMLWGETQFRQVLKVDKEGFIFIPEIGQVFVVGLNLSLLESKLYRVFSQAYDSLNPQNRTPTTFLDISIGNLRPLRVQVLGELDQPGAYIIDPSATLFSALYYFKGPSKLGSLRDIRLIRNNNQIASIDFYDFLLTGKKPADQKLQLDDVIFIPPRLKTVTIKGETKRPGIYELKDDETISDVIEMSGGLEATAYTDRVQIDRIIPYHMRNELGLDRVFKDIDLNQVLKNKNKLKLLDGDTISIFSIFDMRQNYVQLEGAVSRPGSYDLGDSLKLKDLILKADSLNNNAYFERADIIRKGKFDDELIKINLEKALDGDPQHNISLMGFDKVLIYDINQVFDKSYVSIRGEISRPGPYLLQQNMKVTDLIFQAGGLIDENKKSNVLMERADVFRKITGSLDYEKKTLVLKEILLNENSAYNFELKPSDELVIYSKSTFRGRGIVTLGGDVKNPGEYTLKLGMTLIDLLMESGGIKDDVFDFRLDISRIDPALNANSSQSVIFQSFNIKKTENSYEIIDATGMSILNEYQLKSYDLIHVRKAPFFKLQETITISGEVLFPGEYVLKNKNEKIAHIIERSGGLKKNAYLSGGIFMRGQQKIRIDFSKAIKKKGSSYNITMEKGDQIIIPKNPNSIMVYGEVQVPGLYQFDRRLRVDDVIKNAGGFTTDADLKNIFITKVNGKSKKYSRFLNNPKVQDGILVQIGKKKELEPFDTTEYLRDLSSIIASIIQAITMVVIAKT